MTTTQNSSEQPYRVHKGGAGAWYIQEVATGELKGGFSFKTKRAAQIAVDGWNERRAQPKRPNLTVVRS